jgi:poly(A) polymerase
MIQRFIKKLFNSTPSFNVVEEAAHGLSPDSLPNGALQVVEVLQDKGYDAFLVGGAVRDLLLGRRPKDFDVATSATPEQVKRCFRRAYIIGRRFRIVHVHLGSELIEVTTFRGGSDQKVAVDEHGRILSDNAFGSHIEDAARRDFTINALYYDPTENTVWDAHQGLADLRKKKLQLIGKAPIRFREDPVRMLRILRFSAKLGFQLDRATEKSVAQLSHLLDVVPPARLADEFGKFLMGGYALDGLCILAKWRLLSRFLDGVSEGADYTENLSPMMQIALTNADRRHAEEKSLSLSFLVAALMWSNVAKWEKSYLEKGLPAPVAFQDAMNEAIFRQQQKISLTKAVIAEVRDIWMLQNNLIAPRPKWVPRLLESHRLTAGINFLEIRATTRLSGATHPMPFAEDDTLQYPHPDSRQDESCAFWAAWWRTLLSQPFSAQQQWVNDWERALYHLKIPRNPKPRARGARKPRSDASSSRTASD